MDAIYLDTHAAVWLYAGETTRFPRTVKGLLGKRELLISPAVSLEIQFLFEIGRLTVSGAEIIAELQTLGLHTCDESYRSVVEAALDLSWTRDPFDRLIVAHADLRRTRLVTKDATIRAHYSRAVWD